MIKEEDFIIMNVELDNDYKNLERGVFIYTPEIWKQPNKEIGRYVGEILEYFSDKDYIVKSIKIEADEHVVIETTRFI